MYNQTFIAADLKKTLEEALDFRIKSFERIGGGGAINFKAIRELDELCFVVKCFPPDRRLAGKQLADNLKALEGAKVSPCLFHDKCPDSFADHTLLCLQWQDGVTLPPDMLTDAQWENFLNDFDVLSKRMQGIRLHGQKPSAHELWTNANVVCHGLGGCILRTVLNKIGNDSIDYQQGVVRIIHGDFHSGNILFSNGNVVSFMDFETLQLGCPAEDLCVLLMVAARKLKKSEKNRRNRLLQMFERAVKRSNLSPKAWHTAINILFLKSLCNKTNGFKHLGIKTAFEMIERDKVCNLFRHHIDVAFGAPP